ncbi:MAG: hypothetical protein H7239_15230, partial [Flavobacterium sp.]|nr:hypothetical protein [Flavobacterium sp.]
METKETMLQHRFNSSNRYQLKINKHSKEYQYYETTINEMINKHTLTLYEKIRNTLVLKYNHCYTSDLGIKQ